MSETKSSGLYGWKLWDDGLEVTDARYGAPYQRAVIEIDDRDGETLLVYDRELLAELCRCANGGATEPDPSGR